MCEGVWFGVDLVWFVLVLCLCPFYASCCIFLEIIVWELHVVASEGVGVRLVWLGSWFDMLRLLNNNLFPNSLLIYQSLYKYVI